MALNLASGAPPIFLGENLFNRFADLAADLVCSSGNDMRDRLYDMDPKSKWNSIGSSDIITETIEFGIWDQGVQDLVDIDTIVILGHNLLAFTIELSEDDGNTWPHSYTYAGVATSYTIKNLLATIQANRFRLTMTTSQDGGEKEVGCIILGLANFQAADRPVIYKRLAPMVNDKSARMYNGTLRRSYPARSAARVDLASRRIGFVDLDDDEGDAFDELCLTSTPFIVCFQPYDQPTEWLLGCAVPHTYVRDYYHLSQAGGWAVSFDFEEAGGA